MEKAQQFLSLKLSMGDQKPAQVGMDSLLQFNPELYLGEERITPEELKAILAETAGYTSLRASG